MTVLLEIDSELPTSLFHSAVGLPFWAGTNPKCVVAGLRVNPRFSLTIWHMSLEPGGWVHQS